VTTAAVAASANTRSRGTLAKNAATAPFVSIIDRGTRAKTLKKIEDKMVEMKKGKTG